MNKTGSITRPVRGLLQAAALTAAALAAPHALAQFSMVPTPMCKEVKPSDKDVEREYRIDAARHLYSCFPMRVYRGKLPPLLYGIMTVETELDSEGKVLNVSVVRNPAAEEVAPWVIAMIKRGAPYPPPAKFPGGVLKFAETFFVDKSGLFQTFTLTEGQR